MSTPINEPLHVTADIKNATTVLIKWDGNPQVDYYFEYWEFPTGTPIRITVRGVEFPILGLTTGRRYTVSISGGGRKGGTTFVPREIPEPLEKPNKSAT